MCAEQAVVVCRACATIVLIHIASSQNGQSALYTASEAGNVDVVGALLDAKADVHQASNVSCHVLVCGPESV